MSGDQLHGKQPIKFYNHELTESKKVLIEFHLKSGQESVIEIQYEYDEKVS